MLEEDKNKIFSEYIKRYVYLNEEEEVVLFDKLKYRTYLKGQYIVQAGDISRFQTFIISGKARTFYLDDNGNEHVISFGIESWWVGDICSFNEQIAAEFSTQCLDKTEVIQISYDNLQHLLQKIPKLERFFRLLIQKAYASLQKRIVRNYSLSAKERYILFCEEYPQIAQRVPQYMIASYLGITKEFLSTIRKQIANKKR